MYTDKRGTLTRRSCLPQNSGFWAGQPTAGRQRCRIWRRRRSRAAARCPAWAVCPAARSPGYAYLGGDARTSQTERQQTNIRATLGPKAMSEKEFAIAARVRFGSWWKSFLPLRCSEYFILSRLFNTSTSPSTFIIKQLQGQVHQVCFFIHLTKLPWPCNNNPQYNKE